MYLRNIKITSTGSANVTLSNSTVVSKASRHAGWFHSPVTIAVHIFAPGNIITFLWQRTRFIIMYCCI